jgi:hypothetical protein
MCTTFEDKISELTYKFYKIEMMGLLVFFFFLFANVSTTRILFILRRDPAE